jgi:hypothetical protein
MFRAGYIVSGRADLLWYLGLPFLAVAFALACQHWLSAVAMASVALWINAPHVYSTLLRAYGLSEDRQRFRDRLIVGPLVIFAFAASCLTFAPLTLLFVTEVWNQQHFMMQIHGFTRIYDYKARAGAPNTGRWDLLLNVTLYLNMFIAAPLFVSFWVRELLRLGVPLNAGLVQAIQQVSWSAVALVGVCYLGHVVRSLARGYALNPIKYIFLASNVAVLYYVSWSSASVLLYAVTNQIMHGLQYLVIVYYFLQRKCAQPGQGRSFVGWLTRPQHVLVFLGICLLFAAVQQTLLGKPLGEFGFGVIGTMGRYQGLPDLGLGDLSASTRFQLFAAAMLTVPNLLHLYFDSFIWKVRDNSSQGGL